MPPGDRVIYFRSVSDYERLRALAGTAKLDPDFSEKFLRFIIDEVIRHHQGMRR